VHRLPVAAALHSSPSLLMTAATSTASRGTAVVQPPSPRAVYPPSGTMLLASLSFAIRESHNNRSRGIFQRGRIVKGTDGFHCTCSVGVSACAYA
jgi:hypothetical protein